MEQLSFSRLKESDFDDIIKMVGGERFTDNKSISTKNCDYKFENILIELKIIEEEPLAKKLKQNKLAELFRSDIKTVILNPSDLDFHKKRKYYNELSTPIKTAIKKASQQLKASANNNEYKIAIIVNNGLSMTSPDEFLKLAIQRAQNDTSNIDLLIVCGVYHYSDGFETIATTVFEDVKIQSRDTPIDFLENLKNSWNTKINKYITKQISAQNIERTKKPIQDIYFELNNIRYVKPSISWGENSNFYGKSGRPRNDTTGMNICPPIGVVLPIFDEDGYKYVKQHICNDDRYLLQDNLKKYIFWTENKKLMNDNVFRPIIPIQIPKEDLIKISGPLNFSKICNFLLPIFQKKVIQIYDRRVEFDNTSERDNYILLQVNEIGMDKANDIAFISHITNNSQQYLITGERMKFEYAIMIASAYCLSLNSNKVYYLVNDDFKWK